MCELRNEASVCFFRVRARGGEPAHGRERDGTGSLFGLTGVLERPPKVLERRAAGAKLLNARYHKRHFPRQTAVLERDIFQFVDTATLTPTLTPTPTLTNPNPPRVHGSTFHFNPSSWARVVPIPRFGLTGSPDR